MITELKIGDYIEKSELDTEQKYNDVVEVFKQWGFKTDRNTQAYSVHTNKYKCTHFFVSEHCGVDSINFSDGFEAQWIGRKLTYDQVMSLKKVDVDNLNIDKVVSNEEVGGIIPPYDPRAILSSYKDRELVDKSELLKLYAAADGLIRLGYVWDEEEKAWCKISKEYL